LWADAVRKLSYEDQEAMKKLQPASSLGRPFSETVSDLLSLTENARTKCKEKSLKLRFKGKELIIRDITGKIISWLNKFKEIGDIVVNFDPVHAALPCEFRFLGVTPVFCAT
jgi:hypothetical protein